MSDDAGTRAWLALPRRIYLDTSTLQSIYDFGEVIFDGEPFAPVGRSARVEGLAAELDALRKILLVNQRAMFEFVVTAASLREVQARNRAHYTQWVYDVIDSWLLQSEGQGPPIPGATFTSQRFGMISRKDRRLLQEALDWKSQAFVTMERRLLTAAEFIERETRLRVMRPTTYWSLLSPWARLYY